MVKSHKKRNGLKENFSHYWVVVLSARPNLVLSPGPGLLHLNRTALTWSDLEWTRT